MPYSVLEYPNGTVVEAVVLMAEGTHARVVTPGAGDTMELTRTGAGWVGEDAEPVEFGFLLALGADTEARGAPAKPLARAAG